MSANAHATHTAHLQRLRRYVRLQPDETRPVGQVLLLEFLTRDGELCFPVSDLKRLMNYIYHVSNSVST